MEIYKNKTIIHNDNSITFFMSWMRLAVSIVFAAVEITLLKSAFDLSSMFFVFCKIRLRLCEKMRRRDASSLVC